MLGLIGISVTAVISCFLLTIVCVLFLVIARARQARDRQIALSYALQVTNSQLTRFRENETVSERDLWGNDRAALDPSNTNKSASDISLIIVCGVGVLLLPVIGLLVIFGNFGY